MYVEKLDIGSTLTTTVNTFLQNIVIFIAIAAVVSIPSTAMTVLSERAAENFAYDPSFNIGVLVPLFLAPLVKILESFVISGAIIVGVYRYLSNKEVTVNECVSIALSKLFPIILASMLATMVIGFGTLLLIIPGIIFMLKYYVIIPTIVVEDYSVSGSLGRSNELTRGNKWHILATIFIVGLINAFATGFLTGTTSAVDFPLITIPINFAVQAVVSAFGGTLVGVIYFNLRLIHDGVNVEDIAAVFE